MYLKDNIKIVENEVALSKKENYIFGAKIVRGAYIFTETEVGLFNPFHFSSLNLLCFSLAGKKQKLSYPCAR